MKPPRSLLVTAGLLVVSLLAGCQAGDQARWYKGNLHTHTLWSDGNHFPEMVVDWYASRDYQFLALTDHNIVADHEKWVGNDQVISRGGRTALADYRSRFGADWVQTRDVEGKLQVRLKTLEEFRPLFEKPGGFLLIPAEEITSGFDKKPIHINASNVAEVIAAQQGTSVEDVIRKTLLAVQHHAEEHHRPVLAHLNHPNFGWGVTAEELAHVVEERFFEVYNGHPSVHHLGDETRPGVEKLWDIANTIRLRDLHGPVLFGLGTDDSHNYHNATGSTPGRGWVMVKARELTAAALIEAIECGDFYASSGVVLDDVRRGRSELAIDIHAAQGATYVTEFIGTRVGSEHIGEVFARVEGLHPSYRLRGDELFVRATVTSSLAPENPVFEGQFRQAWVQPVVPGQRPSASGS
ncbi:MAG: hypothetical protein H6838_11815 [Planctomycetes bacterium]|nr:hypothetical protein [Planctomycetota bacterium]MCB9886173.1 hypothetical protein [Planctomycetota bacterium]